MKTKLKKNIYIIENKNSKKIREGQTDYHWTNQILKKACESRAHPCP